MRGRQSGRTQEIQRLIGRSLRAITDLEGFGERQITVDCDVLQADGGTRSAAITGAYVALHLAFKHLVTKGEIESLPLTDQVAAVSCGIVEGLAVLDLDYAEDSGAETDANFVMTAGGKIVEIQGSAERQPFSEEDFLKLLGLARGGIARLVRLQRAALGLKKKGGAKKRPGLKKRMGLKKRGEVGRQRPPPSKVGVTKSFRASES